MSVNSLLNKCTKVRLDFILIELRLDNWMPTEHRFSWIVDHVEPMISTNSVVFADTFVQADAT